MSDRKSHWENIYSTKRSNEVSWTQNNPTASLALFEKLNLPKKARIIDVGGGESHLVDQLLERGYQNITVLDISQNALDKTRDRLGHRGNSVQWVVSDISEFESDQNFEFWHDRATFHFMTTPQDIAAYLEKARRFIKPNGHLALGTFSNNGPLKCSGLRIIQYSEASMQLQLKDGFKKLDCFTEDHQTPFGTLQNFIFCLFKRFDI